jgi:hypothetical protein
MDVNISTLFLVTFQLSLPLVADDQSGSLPNPALWCSPGDYIIQFRHMLYVIATHQAFRSTIIAGTQNYGGTGPKYCHTAFEFC